MRPTRDGLSGEWIAPFVMAATNTRVVQRTHALLGRPWGDGFLYDEAMRMGDNVGGAIRATAVSAASAGFVVAAAVPPTRWLIDRFLPAPGEGPSPEAQQRRFVRRAVVRRMRRR